MRERSPVAAAPVGGDGGGSLMYNSRSTLARPVTDVEYPLRFVVM